MEPNLDGLFRTKLTWREWAAAEMKDFWKFEMRKGFVYAMWSLLMTYYMYLTVMAVIENNPRATALGSAAMIWFGMFMVESHFHSETREILHRTFKSWSSSLDQWAQTARLLGKSESERNQLQERIDNMLGTDGK